MKKIKFILVLLVLYTLNSNESYSQSASCTLHSSAYGSCYANVGSEGVLLNDEWAMTSATGHAYLYAEVNSAEANIWGDVPQLYVSSEGASSGSSSLSNLTPNQVYYIGVTIYTPDAGYAWLSVTTW